MTGYIPYGVDAWIELDGIPGHTGNDTTVTERTILDAYVTVQIGECQEW